MFLEVKFVSHWNHRVVKKENVGQFVIDEDRYSFGIHEVYYDDDGSISSCTVNAVDPYGTTLEELKECMDMMQRAFEAPLLDYDTDIPDPCSTDADDAEKSELDEIFDGCDAQDGC